MLFSNIDELQAVLPVNQSTSFELVQPFIEYSEDEYIVPYLSQAEYDALNTAYNGGQGTLDTAQANLLKKVHRALANFAMLHYLPHAQLQQGNEGLHRVENEMAKTPYQYQVRDLGNAYRAAAWRGIESMLQFLEANAATYTSWAASPARTNQKKHFINTAGRFSEIVYIASSRVLYLRLRSLMDNEEGRIQAIIGSDKCSEIKAQIAANTLTSANTDLLKLIEPPVAHLTMHAALQVLPVQVSTDGAYILSTDRTEKNEQRREPATPEYLRARLRFHERKANEGLELLQKHWDILNPPEAGTGTEEDDDTKGLAMF